MNQAAQRLFNLGLTPKMAMRLARRSITTWYCILTQLEGKYQAGKFKKRM